MSQASESAQSDNSSQSTADTPAAEDENGMLAQIPFLLIQISLHFIKVFEEISSELNESLPPPTPLDSIDGQRNYNFYVFMLF